MVPSVTKVIQWMLAMQRHPWEQGVCAQALYESGRDELWIPMAYDAVKRQLPDGRLAMVGGGAAVSDPAANGEVCLRAYQRSRNPFYLHGAQRMLDYLQHTAPRTADGIICHNSVSFEEGYSAAQLWIDGLYMVPPFLAVMGLADEAAEQVRGYIRHLFDEKTGLFFHIADTESGRFVRKKHWATGNGWALMGLARVAEAAEEAGRTDIRNEMVSFLTALLESMLAWQDADGRFHDILDDPASFKDGTSSFMMAATVFRGIYHGYVSSSCLGAAEAAYRTAAEKTDDTGLVREVCGCPDFISAGTAAEAQAAFVMADAWRRKLDYKEKTGENQPGDVEISNSRLTEEDLS